MDQLHLELTQVLALIDQLLQLEQDVREVLILEYHLTRYDWTEGKQRASFCDQGHLKNIERKIVNRFCTSLGKPDDDLVLDRENCESIWLNRHIDQEFLSETN